ncbi:putative membrane protein [Acinetobacter baumannii 496487]|uniref:Putative membrane protein n=1 Tax=Acinetobacter baumannii 1499986 TaxID=1310673 RepID=A0A837AAK7_ACIBA|nr:putative membrane protein [Acinetobacter baumannii 397971]EXG13111.1 putative membrane protein [Acinetobacter baumannii 722310]EXH59112.1 putative membrane protein [Acinetobacter baumannii 1533268]EXH97610.1 putative membrane protein [Acinetobacter baumannii 457946]EXH97662.1 putative membrane protein [Acinetobacter baumannii 607805]EXQ93755.1 putative membrane protein [Acinetobacter baumannii 1170863]EXR15383.1 putative membrane protein [Acinetobacter baumannii 1413735]EXR73421.1 putativ
MIQTAMFKLTYWGIILNFLKILSIYLMCTVDINNEFS